MIKNVYLLWHVNKIDDDIEDNKLLGAYSSKKKAQNKIEYYRTLPGFCNSPDGFIIDKYTINQDEWTEGFITIYT